MSGGAGRHLIQGLRPQCQEANCGALRTGSMLGSIEAVTPVLGWGLGAVAAKQPNAMSRYEHRPRIDALLGAVPAFIQLEQDTHKVHVSWGVQRT